MSPNLSPPRIAPFPRAPCCSLLLWPCQGGSTQDYWYRGVYVSSGKNKETLLLLPSSVWFFHLCQRWCPALRLGHANPESWSNGEGAMRYCGLPCRPSSLSLLTGGPQTSSLRIWKTMAPFISHQSTCSHGGMAPSPQPVLHDIHSWVAMRLGLDWLAPQTGQGSEGDRKELRVFTSPACGPIFPQRA